MCCKHLNAINNILLFMTCFLDFANYDEVFEVNW